MNKKFLKSLVNEVMNESWGVSSNRAPSSYSSRHAFAQNLNSHHNDDDMDDDEQSPTLDRLKEILKNLDDDPGYEQAINICKILVKNKRILRDMLELLIEQEELTEEFVNSYEESS